MSKPTPLGLADVALEPRQDADRLQQRALVVGALFSVLTAVGFFLNPQSFYRPYLIAWLLVLGVAMGLFAICMLNHVSGGRWGVLMRRVLEASGRTLPFFLLAGLPLLTGLEHIYPWAVPGAADHDPLLQHKAVYLNPNGFTARLIIILVLWSVVAYAMSYWSHRQDQTGDDAYRRKMGRLAAGGLILYMLTGTLGAVDWIMSLDPHWFSSLFGAAFVVGQALSGFAFAIPMLLFLSRRKPLDTVGDMPGRFHDFGKLMFALMVVWAYFAVSQYLIIWSGNMPEEITWYLDRSANGWQILSFLLVVGHFALPFFILLSRDIKRKAQRLIYVAFWLLAMRWLDLYWQITPSLSRESVIFSWLDITAVLGLGGLWLALLIAQFKNRALLPVREPALQEVLAHG